MRTIVSSKLASKQVSTKLNSSILTPNNHNSKSFENLIKISKVTRNGDFVDTNFLKTGNTYESGCPRNEDDETPVDSEKTK